MKKSLAVSLLIAFCLAFVFQHNSAVASKRKRKPTEQGQKKVAKKRKKDQKKQDASCVCSMCGKTLSCKSNLNVHVRTVHDKKKLFQCEVCEKFYSDHTSLRRHKFLHTGEKPFECPVCHQRFTQKGNMRTHMKKKHQGEEGSQVASASSQAFEEKLEEEDDNEQLDLDDDADELSVPVTSSHTSQDEFQAAGFEAMDNEEGSSASHIGDDSSVPHVPSQSPHYVLQSPRSERSGINLFDDIDLKSPILVSEQSQITADQEESNQAFLSDQKALPQEIQEEEMQSNFDGVLDELYVPPAPPDILMPRLDVDEMLFDDMDLELESPSFASEQNQVAVQEESKQVALSDDHKMAQNVVPQVIQEEEKQSSQNNIAEFAAPAALPHIQQDITQVANVDGMIPFPQIKTLNCARYGSTVSPRALVLSLSKETSVKQALISGNEVSGEAAASASRMDLEVSTVVSDQNQLAAAQEETKQIVLPGQAASSQVIQEMDLELKAPNFASKQNQIVAVQEESKQVALSDDHKMAQKALPQVTQEEEKQSNQNNIAELAAPVTSPHIQQDIPQLASVDEVSSGATSNDNRMDLESKNLVSEQVQVVVPQEEIAVVQEEIKQIALPGQAASSQVNQEEKQESNGARASFMDLMALSILASEQERMNEEVSQQNRGDSSAPVLGVIAENVQPVMQTEAVLPVNAQELLNDDKKVESRQEVDMEVVQAKPFKCQKCDRRFARKDSRKRHMETDHEKKRFTCPECDKEFTQKVHMNKHMKNHINAKEKPFKCPKCPNRFTRKNNMQAHIKSHHQAVDEQKSQSNKRKRDDSKALALGVGVEHVEEVLLEEGTLKCDQCGQRFDRKDKMVLHMRMHTGEKPFECEECSKKFARKDQLKVHMRNHTGEKPFKCPLPECGQRFTQKHHIQSHLKKHEKEKNRLHQNVVAALPSMPQAPQQEEERQSNQVYSDELALESRAMVVYAFMSQYIESLQQERGNVSREDWIDKFITAVLQNALLDLKVMFKEIITLSSFPVEMDNLLSYTSLAVEIFRKNFSVSELMSINQQLDKGMSKAS